MVSSLTTPSPSPHCTSDWPRRCKVYQQGALSSQLPPQHEVPAPASLPRGRPFPALLLPARHSAPSSSLLHAAMWHHHPAQRPHLPRLLWRRQGGLHLRLGRPVPVPKSWPLSVLCFQTCFKCFSLFQIYISSVSYGCCKSRSGCCICCNGYIACFKCMFQVFHLF
jgi:hypothetical protein